MRFTTTILLMLLFVVSQYARQFNYLECKVANTFRETIATCSCESAINYPVSDTQKKLPVAANHYHPLLDEFFLSGTAKTSALYNYNLISSFFVHIEAYVLTGFTTESERPPCC